ncbi:hypothetical protein NB640_11765 [Oxalobacter vibrioformis]|uniref:Phage tail collar domain-containing protein n=1 Tax=Oxalobacter vibrioformis TaxID=933080 RepID=A0A9E9LYE9_9BURK|nr:hypothetical protein [Oxalobacter vibrioformis]WAW09880.1 hypothetical protein NB640_11765 [Oxalobacter vibrioformis]
MAQPPAYNRSKDFTENTTDSTDHAALNAELDRASLSMNSICTNLALIQGNDGRLLPDAVTIDAIDDSVIDYLAAGVRLELQPDFQRVSDAVLVAEASATSAATSATQASDSAALCSQYNQDVTQNRDAVQRLADASSTSAASAADSATLADQHKESAALYKYQAQLESESAAASAQTAVNSASQAGLYEQGAVEARDTARGWAESASASATSAASSAAAAANSATQIAQVVREVLHLLEDVRASAATAATSAGTAAIASTAASGSANAALIAVQSSGLHAAAAEASKDAAAVSAAAAAASAGNAGQSAEAATSGAMSATAGGTPDVITACFKGGVSEPPKDHVVMYVRALGANETTTPTFKPGGATPRVIVKGNNLPLAVGDIAGAGFEMPLQYNAAYDRFVLLNPAWGVYNSSVPVGTIMSYAGTEAPAGYLSLADEGSRYVPVAEYRDLAEAVWCGVDYNNTADFFFRCDLADGTSRNADGAYLALPVGSRYFLRGRDVSGVVHPYQYQRDTFQGHWHKLTDSTVSKVSNSSYGRVLMDDVASSHSNPVALMAKGAISDGVNGTPRIANETRPMNFPVMWCIKALNG